MTMQIANHPKRKVFFSFHFADDAWRAAQVRNIGKIYHEVNEPATDNDWETVKRNGDRAIQNWIENQLHGRTCTVVLIGRETHSRKWVRYEVERSWDLGKGVVGICIHSLEDQRGRTSLPGKNFMPAPIRYITRKEETAKKYTLGSATTSQTLSRKPSTSERNTQDSNAATAATP